MRIPEDKNTRAEAMWRIISRNVDFRGKNIFDFGCGHGEMLWRFANNHALYVFGIDNSIKPEAWILALDWPDIFVGQKDINDLVLISKKRPMVLENTIAVCFSVLPYLDDVEGMLRFLGDFEMALIEAQYEPEPYNIGVSNDEEMRELLLANGFAKVEALGKTEVKVRNTFRTIWRCE